MDTIQCLTCGKYISIDDIANHTEHCKPSDADIIYNWKPKPTEDTITPILEIDTDKLNKVKEQYQKDIPLEIPQFSPRPEPTYQLQPTNNTMYLLMARPRLNKRGKY